MKATCETEEMVVDTRTNRLLQDNSMVKKVVANTAENLFHLKNTVDKLVTIMGKPGTSNSATTTNQTMAGVKNSGGKNRGGKNSGGKKRKRKNRTGYFGWDQEEEDEFVDPNSY